MGEEREYTPANLFCGIIFRLEPDYVAVKNILQHRYSEIDLESERFPFTETDYYQSEMGSPLFRRFISFSTPISPERLSSIKLATNAVEKEMSEEGRRRVNLDPGILSENNVIIATTKNYAHRVPLQAGIYAHLEYTFRCRQWQLLEWTYPDFRTEAYLGFFLRLRELYKKKRR